jgi:hypothetical protein
MLKLTVTLVALAIVITAIACRSTKQNLNKAPDQPATPAPQANSNSNGEVFESKVIERNSPFDHSRKEHKARECNTCHQRTDNDAVPKFPGHPACIDCHQKDFVSRNSQMCVVCHKVPLDAQPQLISFPAKLAEFGIKGFSHRDHMNPEKMKGQLASGGDIKCDLCHRFDSRGVEASFPKHPECFSCHTHQAGQKLAGCTTCHTNAAASMKFNRGTGSALTLYNFRHGPHLKAASCDKCHRTTEVAAQQPRSDILQISTARGQRHTSACWSCHVQARESVCTKCHVGSRPF